MKVGGASEGYNWQMLKNVFPAVKREQQIVMFPPTTVYTIVVYLNKNIYFQMYTLNVLNAVFYNCPKVDF